MTEPFHAEVTPVSLRTLDPTKCKGWVRSEDRQCTNRPMTGLAVCRMHGVNKRTKAAGQAVAKKQEATQKIGYLLAHAGSDYTNVDPIVGLQLEMARARASVVVWGMEVAKLDSLLTPDQARKHPTVAAWEDAIERHAKICKLAADAGIAERELAITEETAGLFVVVISRVLDGLMLTSQQRQVAGELVPRELRAITAK